MNVFSQMILSILALGSKFFLARRKIFGWSLGILTGLLAGLYLAFYTELPILATLEFSSSILCAYGFYKQYKSKENNISVDVVIFTATGIIITYFALKLIGTNTVWYQTISSVAFLAGVPLLAQRNSIYKISGWLLYVIGHVGYGISLYINSSYILFILQIVSVCIAIYGIIMEIKKSNIQTA